MSHDQPAETVARALASFVPRLARNIAVALQEEPSLQLSLRQLRILERLAERPHRTSELAVHSMVSQPTATAAVAPLEVRGLVRRLPDPEDRRAYLVELTADGSTLLRDAHERIQQRLLTIVGEVSPGEAADVERLGTSLIDGMERARADRATRTRAAAALLG